MSYQDLLQEIETMQISDSNVLYKNSLIYLFIIISNKNKKNIIETLLWSMEKTLIKSFYCKVVPFFQ